MQTIKCVVIGDSYVGKTNMLIRYTFDIFTGDYLPTNKSSFDNYESIVLIEDEEIKFDVYDTGGEDYFTKIRKQVYSQIHVVILCFSIAAPWTYDNIKTSWIYELKGCNINVPYILVGTKLDLRNDKETVEMLKQKNLKPISTSLGLKLAKDINAVKYLECSSLTGNGVRDVIKEAAIAGLFGRKCEKTEMKCIAL